MGDGSRRFAADDDRDHGRNWKCKRRGRGEGQERVGVVQESSHRAAAAESKRERGLVPRAAERGAPALVAPALPLDPAGAGEVEI